MTATITITALSAGLVSATALAGGGNWVDFNDETSSRLVASTSLGSGDTEEKDYAWGDVDNDGDLDLVCVRKQPFTSTGKRANVLFMNEGIADGQAIDGVLVDRTTEFASDSDVPGDNGFLTPTNDRDVVLSDLDLDGWLDIITAVTLTDGESKHLSHPRVYMNLGEDGKGEWLGFRHEDARMPQMDSLPGDPGPRFCSVAVGDVTGDRYPDLHFGDYDTPPSTQIEDFNNRILINNGAGFFTDETNSRFTSTMRNSAFGAASIIIDVNGDGHRDIVKQTSLNSPLHVAIIYNDSGGTGNFNFYDDIYDLAPYFVSAGDLNNDGMVDLVITDDGTDQFLVNTGNDGAGHANFTSGTFPGSGGFGSNSVIVDLNNDGLNDVVIADVDVDISGCNRRTFIYRNLGGDPLNFEEQGEPIADSLLRGVHDIGAFDVNGDGWTDLVLGRCSGTTVWINQPPAGLVFTYPQGLPAFVPPGEQKVFQVQLDAVSGDPDPGSADMFLSLNGGPFNQVALNSLGNDLYEATLPSQACTDRYDYYFTGDIQGGESFSDPPGAPGESFSAISAEGTILALRDDLEGDVSAWSVQGSPSSGAWETAEPNGTTFNAQQAAPDDDNTQGAEFTLAFVTQNGPPGGGATADDVDGGPTHLLSPTVDLDGTDGIISYSRWFFSDGDAGHLPDSLVVDISNNGGKDWVNVPSQTTGGTGSAWETASFLVSDFVTPSSDIVVRFSTDDSPNDSVTEAGIDNFQVDRFVCVLCDGDLDGDNDTDQSDLGILLAAYLQSADGDLDGDNDTDQSDLGILLSNYGCDE